MPKHAPVTDAVSTAAYLDSHALTPPPPFRLSPHAVADCSWSVWFSLCLPSCQSATQRRRETERDRGGGRERERSLALRLQIDAALMHTVEPGLYWE